MKNSLTAPARVLIVDDNRAIHDDIRKILRPEEGTALALRAAEAALFGEADPVAPVLDLDLSSAYQGEAAVEAVQEAVQAGHPFAMAFMDVRMPPGLDGIETTARLWNIDPDLQVVLCTAYSDYGWNDVRAKLGHTDNLVILKKPFDNIEVLQLAYAMTEKWRLARQARAKMSDLEEMVRQRTAELRRTNEELKKEILERKQAEEALRRSQELLLQKERLAVVGQLSAGVAHDFNNIMTIIQGHANLLAMGGPTREGLLDSVHEIDVAAGRAAKLTRQLLAFSRKQVMQPREVCPAVLMNRLASLIEPSIGGFIRLTVECPHPLPIIVADGGAIEQALMNLVANARDAMPDGGDLRIFVESVCLRAGDINEKGEGRPGEFVCVSIQDTGCGMDEETRRHLFEPFFTTKDVGKGSGLGLATAYGIVQQHHGWIEVTSKVGQGSTFRVFLPVSGSTTAR